MLEPGDIIFCDNVNYKKEVVFYGLFRNCIL